MAVKIIVGENDLETFYKYLTENDNTSKIDLQSIERKNEMIQRIIKAIDDNKTSSENEGILKGYNKIKEIVETTENNLY